MTAIRKLAAIMFSDIVGYTSLMGSDEDLAFKVLAENRALHTHILNKHNGRLIKELGDGILACFDTVSDAVEAAVEIQNGSAQSDNFQLRIGIHLGEIVEENGDVFGDGVNIASRIQNAATPGTIFISEPVYKTISNRKNIKSRFLGNTYFKNVKDSVNIYEVLTNENSIASNPPPRFGEQEKSIAVLPFVNMSNDEDQEYFSDGMSEEILNSLAHIKELKVAGRTSSFQFKGKKIDLREVGNKLNVTYVLEGSVRKQQNKVRITTQLIKVSDGYHLWSERYDRQLDDIFAIQDEIAEAVTEKLKITLLKSSSKPKKPATQNTIAHSLFLKGRHEWNKRTKDGFIKSIEFYNEAIANDPGYSLAYAGIADSYLLLCAYHIISPEDGMPKAKVAAEKAIELKSDLAEAHEATGHIDLLFGNDWEKTEKYYKRAIELNSNFATAHQRYALMLIINDRCDEALNEINKAVELDPLSTIINTDQGLIQLHKGDIKGAISTCRKVLDLNPGFPVALFILGLALEENGNLDEAIKSFELSVKTSRNNPIGISALGHALIISGRIKEAEAIMNELAELRDQRFVSPYCMAVMYAGFGKTDLAISELEKAVAMHSTWAIHLHFSSDPRFRILKSDPRYQKLLKDSNIPK